MKIKEIHQSRVSESILGKLAQGAKSAAGTVGRAAGSFGQGFAQKFGADDPARYGFETPWQSQQNQQQKDTQNKLAALNLQAQRLQRYAPQSEKPAAGTAPTLPTTVPPPMASATDAQGWVNLGQGLSVKPATSTAPTMARYGKKLYSLDDQGNWNDDRDRLVSQTLSSYFNQALERL